MIIIKSSTTKAMLTFFDTPLIVQLSIFSQKKFNHIVQNGYILGKGDIVGFVEQTSLYKTLHLVSYLNSKSLKKIRHNISMSEQSNVCKKQQKQIF